MRRERPTKGKAKIKAEAEVEVEEESPVGLPAQLQEFIDDVGTNTCVLLVDEIVDESFVQAYANELDRKGGTHEVVRACMSSSCEVARMYFIANDKGSDLREQSWAPDTEPVPAMIDTWSRGTCQGRPRVPPPLSRPASGAYTLSSSSSYGNSQRVSHIRPGSAGGDRSRRSPSRPGSASSAPGGLRATVSTPALSKGSSTGSAGSSGGMVESVVGPGGKIQVVARAPPKPAEAAMTVRCVPPLRAVPCLPTMQQCAAYHPMLCSS